MPRRTVPTNLLFGLVAACAVLTVLSACLISTLVLLRQHQNAIDERRELDMGSEHTMAPLKHIDPWEMNVRVSDSIIPIHYNLLLHPNLASATFKGTVAIDINITNPIEYLTIHAKDLNITETRISKQGRMIPIRSAFRSQRNLFWVILLPDGSKLEPGEVTLTFTFDGLLIGKIVGFYRSTYKSGLSTRVIATSKFEPVDARAAFPCFDEPGLKATYTVTLIRPRDNYIALSNMDVDRETLGPGPDETTVLFKKSVPMSSYLVCFIVCDFSTSPTAIVPNNGKNLPVRVLATENQVAHTDLALTVAKQVTEFYVGYFGIEYALPKLDLIAIPDFVSGAMENWGLITFRETAVLFDPKANSASAEKRVASVVAHEIAHQWFGNLVTMAWWDDLWLNEGFASFMESKALSKAVKEAQDWNMLDQAIIDDMQPVLVTDAALNSHPIVQAVDNPDQINQLFDSVSYDKGQSVLRMLENFMGEDQFGKGLQVYLSNHQFKNARTVDLWNSLDAVINGQGLVPEVMATWTEQMGFPVVHVTRETNQIVLKQKRFLADVDITYNATDSPFEYKWDIPVRYTTSDNSIPQIIWYKRSLPELTIPIGSSVKYVKINSRQIGYYRVNYDPQDWKALTDNMMNLEPLDRAHLINDVYALSGSGYTDFTNTLNMLKYLSAERDYLPWASASTVIKDMTNLLGSTEIFPQFRTYILNLVGNLYGGSEFSWNVPDNDKHLNRLLRVKILSTACSLDHEACLKDVGKLFTDWLANTNTVIAPDLRAIVYLYGMKATGSEKEWNQLWQIYLKETNAQEKVSFLEALANTGETWLLRRYLDYAWSENNVRSQDYLSVIAYIARTPVGAPLMWDYYRLNWPKLVERFGLQHRTLGSTILSVTVTFASELRLNEVQAFYNQYPDAGAGEASRKNALELIQTRIKWIKRNTKSIKDWLDASKFTYQN